MHRAVLAIILLNGCKSENPSDAADLRVAERRTDEVAEMFPQVKAELTLRVTVPGSGRRYQCLLDATKKQKPTRCVVYESTQDYRDYQQASHLSMKRLAEYRELFGIDLPTSVEELISENFSIDKLRAKHSLILFDHVFDSVTFFRNYLTAHQPIYTELDWFPGVEARNEKTKRQLAAEKAANAYIDKQNTELVHLRDQHQERLERRKNELMKKLTALEEKYDLDGLPDVDSVFEDLPYYIKRYPELEELREDFDVLERDLKAAEHLETTEEVGEQTGELPPILKEFYQSDIVQNAHNLSQKRNEFVVEDTSEEQGAPSSDIKQELQSIGDLLSKMAKTGEDDITGEAREQFVELRHLIRESHLFDSDKKKEIIDSIEKRLRTIERKRVEYLRKWRGDTYIDFRDDLLPAIERKVGDIIKSTPDVFFRGRNLLRVSEPLSDELLFCYVDTRRPSQVSCVEPIFTQLYSDFKEARDSLLEKVIECESILGAKLPSEADMLTPNFSMRDVRKKFPSHHRKLFDELEIARLTVVSKGETFRELHDTPGLAYQIEQPPVSYPPGKPSSRNKTPKWKDEPHRDNGDGSSGIVTDGIFEKLDEKSSADLATLERAAAAQREQLMKQYVGDSADKECLHAINKQIWKLRIVQVFEIVFGEGQFDKNNAFEPFIKQHPPLRESYRECKHEILDLLALFDFVESDIPVPELWNELLQQPEAGELPEMLEKFFQLYEEAKKKDLKEKSTKASASESATEDGSMVPVGKRIADQKLKIMRKFVAIHKPPALYSEDYEEYVRKNARREGIRDDFVELAMLAAEKEEEEQRTESDHGKMEADSTSSAEIEEALEEKVTRLIDHGRDITESTDMDEDGKKRELDDIEREIGELRADRLLVLLWSEDVILHLDEDFLDVIERSPLLKASSLEFFKTLAELEPELLRKLGHLEQAIDEIWSDFLRSKDGQELLAKRKSFVQLLLAMKKTEASGMHEETEPSSWKQQSKAPSRKPSIEL